MFLFVCICIKAPVSILKQACVERKLEFPKSQMKSQGQEQGDCEACVPALRSVRCTCLYACVQVYVCVSLSGESKTLCAGLHRADS